MEPDHINEQLLNILLVEDNPGDVLIIKEYLKSAFAKHSLIHFSRLKDAIENMSMNEFDVILLDLGLPDSLGIETLKKLQVSKIKAPVIVLTGLDDEHIALSSLREGAQDYIVKNNLNPEYLQHVIRYSIERNKIQEIQKRHARQFSILSYATSSINESNNTGSIYSAVCKNISRLLNDAFAFVFEFTENKVVRIESIEGLRKFYYQFSNSIEIDFIEDQQKDFSRLPEIDINNLNSFLNGRIHELETGSIDTIMGIFKPYLNLSANELNSIKKIYVAGLVKVEMNHCGLIICTYTKIYPDDLNIIETIRTQAILSILRNNTEAELKISEKRYKNLFNDSPVPKWEEDYSEIKQEVEKLRSQGVSDLRKYLKDNPGMIHEWKSKLKITDMNQATLDFYRAESKEQFIDHICDLIRHETKSEFIEEIALIFEGNTKFNFVRKVHTIDGTKREVIIHRVITEGFRESLKRVLVTILDITDLKRTEENLRASREQIKNFAAYIQNVREEDRTSLAREIHDELGQILTAIKIDVGLLRNKLNNDRESIAPEELFKELNSIYDTVDMVLQTVRKILTDLRPEILDTLGLVEAIKSYAYDYLKRFKIEYKMSTDMPEINVNQAQKIALYRILQEALTNVVRHSEATSVAISLTKKRGKITLKVQDNGVGLKETTNSNSYGIIGMRERAYLLDGELHIKSQPGKGTTIHVEIPVHQKNPLPTGVIR